MATLQGRIVEFYSGQSVAGAVVRVGSASAMTDGNGFFYISNAPGGLQVVEVIHRSLEPWRFQVNFDPNGAYDIGTITAQSRVRAL